MAGVKCREILRFKVFSMICRETSSAVRVAQAALDHRPSFRWSGLDLTQKCSLIRTMVLLDDKLLEFKKKKKKNT